MPLSMIFTIVLSQSDLHAIFFPLLVFYTAQNGHHLTEYQIYIIMISSSTGIVCKFKILNSEKKNMGYTDSLILLNCLLSIYFPVLRKWFNLMLQGWGQSLFNVTRDGRICADALQHCKKSVVVLNAWWLP